MFIFSKWSKNDLQVNHKIDYAFYKPLIIPEINLNYPYFLILTVARSAEESILIPKKKMESKNWKWKPTYSILIRN